VVEGGTFETAYTFASQGQSREARVSVYSPHGLQSEDEFVLWGLLGVCLSRKQPEPTLLATPYWIIKRLGMSLGGCQYDQLRASLERLAAVAYQNTAFYNPVTQQHERITLHFSPASCPRGGGEVPSMPSGLGGSSGRRCSSKCVRRRAARCCSIWTCTGS
jgi:hypothetical protein